MRSVGDKAPLRVERRLEPFEHCIEGVGKLFELVGRTLERDAFVEVGLGERAGGGCHLVNGSQHPARDQPPDSNRRECHDRQRDPRLAEQM